MTLIAAWTATLNDEEYDHLIAALEQLEEHGPVTRRPFVDTLEGSKHANMKELRPRATSDGAHMRVLVRLRPPVAGNHARRREQSRELETVVHRQHSHR